MVNVMKGSLITCDPAMKQFLLHLDETMALGKKFIIQDLDDTHLFVSSDIVEILRNRVDDLMDQISFTEKQQHMEFSVESQFISTDVTALKIVQESVFAGIGNYLHVFNLHNGSLEGKRRIFTQQKIHGFALQDEKLLVYGGRQFMVLSRSRLTDITECKNSQDWILTAEWLENSSLALALAHNIVVLWCDKEKRFLKTVTCEEKCILYSALLLGTSWSDLIMLAGTVFSEIVVWAPGENTREEKPVLQRLKGHQGVIFGLAWDGTLRRVLSCSDDRSVRVWHVSEGDWKYVKVTLEHVSYGHVARVWRVVPAACLLVSAGEDSKLVQYELLSGRQLASHANVHQGGSVWSIDVDPKRRLIVTGGGDGGICVWPLGASPTPDEFPVPGKGASVRRVVLCASGRVLALLQCGDLAVWREQIGWTSILGNIQCNPHAILAVSPCRTRFALSAPFTVVLEGVDGFTSLERDAEPVDLLSLHWPASHLLLAVEVVKGRRKLWRWESGALILWRDWLPDADSGFTVTAALALDDRWLALGGAHGAVTLVDMTGQQASLRVPRVVPGDLVSSLYFRAPVLTATGKEGHVRELELQDAGSLCVRGSEAAQTRLGWLVGFRDTHLGRLTLAFHREHLSLHLHQRTVLSVKCGGGHRSWDLAVTGDIVTLVFVRDHVMHRVQTSLSRIAPPVLRMGLHWRTVNHAVSLTKNLLVSAGDDGGVRVWRPGREEPSATFVASQLVAQLAAHVSSVRALCVSRRGGETTLFSAGGRAQLVAWRVHQENHTVRAELLHSHMLCEPSERCRTPWADTHFRPRPDPETRYMSLSELPARDDSEIRILAACSDAALRIFALTESAGLNLISTLCDVHQCCVLRVTSFEPISFSATTDGELAVWDAQMEQPQWRGRVHQSGINCLAVSSDGLLASGGDDNTVTVNRVSSRGDDVKQCWSSPLGHVAQVTGCAWLPDDVLLTVSADQRLVFWRDGEIVDSYVTTVADLQGLVIWNQQPDGCQLCVYGKGFEVFFLRR